MQTCTVLVKDGYNLNGRSDTTCKYSAGNKFWDEIPTERIIPTVLSGKH